MIYTEVVVVTCGCGFLPLEDAMHATSQQAWEAAAKHVALNPTKCKPQMAKDLAPAALAPPAVIQAPMPTFVPVA